MAPTHSQFYMAYACITNAIIGGDFGVHSLILSYINNIGFGEDGTTIALSISESAMIFSVYLVALVGVPTKIRKMIVGFISVVMASLHPFGTRTNKSQKNKTMNLKRSHNSVFAEMDIHVLLACIKWSEDSFVSLVSRRINSIKGFCSAKIADLVDAFIPRNIFPDFFHVPGIIA
jgi:hypothetical protein